MKIVSLVPSATEIVYALGLGDALVGVTDECDFPTDAVTKPVVSRSAMPAGRAIGPREVDNAVRDRLEAGLPLNVLDLELLQRERPDVILAQDLCRACAMPAGDVRRSLEEIGLDDASVLSLDPRNLEQVLESFLTVGERLDRADQAGELVAGLRERIERVKRASLRLPTIRTFCLEWSDPPFVAGHWVPEMVELAGGTNLLGERELPSREVTWREIGDAGPEVVVFMPCGYYLEEAENESRSLFQHPDFAGTSAARERNVFAVDATSYFSRPRPRIVDGLEILAWAIHPETFPEPAAGTVARLG
jgi:iron complex transport system substrate-binding protein